MAFKIFIPQAIDEVGENFLIEQGYEIIRGSIDNLELELRECDAMILRTLKLRQKELDCAENLKIIARHGAGYDNLDYQYANNLGIATTYSPNSTSVSVAEYTIAMMLTLARQTVRFERELRNDNFMYKFTNKGTDLENKTLAIIGFGNSGQEVAKRAYYGFNMNVITLDRQKPLPEYVKAMDTDQLLTEADFVSLHVPGNKTTYNLVDLEFFKKMKPTAYLINPSRGGVMNEQDFVTAINEGQIAGAAIDVFEVEPPDVSSEIFGLKNVIVTPHMASNTKECMERIAMDCAYDVHCVLSGNKPRYPIKNK